VGGVGLVTGRQFLILGDVLGEAVDSWRDAYARWCRAVEHRDRVTSACERQIVGATGGLGLGQWEAACCRRRIITAAEARLVARAIRARSAVHAAIENAERLREAEDAAVVAARLELAASTKQLLGYGRIGQQLTGLTSEELRWLARCPSTTEAAVRSSPSVGPSAAAE
jgi:hypothetical protein